MEAIVLAGGFGTRLRDVVSDLPKPMAPISGRPFLEIILDRLAVSGFTKVVLSVGYLAQTIVEHFGDEYKGISILYTIETTPLGTGGAIRNSLALCSDDHVYIFNGDTYLDVNINDIEDLWKRKYHPIIVGIKVDDAQRYGRLKFDDCLVTGFEEKGESGPGIINAGCYVFPRDLLNNFEPGKPFSIETDFLEYDVSHHPYELYISSGKFIDIGIPDDYFRAQNEL